MARVCVFLSIVFLAISCGSDKESSASSSASGLQGTWKSECMELSANSHMIVTLTNTETTSIQESTEYGNDAKCFAPVYISTANRTYEIVGDVEGLTNAKKVNYTYQATAFTFKTQDAVNEANNAELFGYSDWKLNEGKDVTGKKSSADDLAVEDAGEVSYLIFKIDGNKFIPGDTSVKDGSSEDERPTTLSTSIVLNKQ